MTSARSRMLSNSLGISVTAVALFMATAFTASAQAPPDLFTRVETLTLSDGTPAAGLVSLSGDTAVVSTCASCSSGGVGHDDVVHVFERESSGGHWVHSATLVARWDIWFRQDGRHRRHDDGRGRRAFAR